MSDPAGWTRIRELEETVRDRNQRIENLSHQLNELEAERVSAEEAVAIAAVIKAADLWKQSLVATLTSHGHDAECDKVLTEAVAECDCWWQEVWNALKGMEDVADMGRISLGLPPLPDKASDG